MKQRYGQFYKRFLAATAPRPTYRQSHSAQYDKPLYHETFTTTLIQTDGSTVTMQSPLRLGVKPHSDQICKVETVKDTISHSLWNDIVGSDGDALDAANESYARFAKRFETESFDQLVFDDAVPLFEVKPKIVAPVKKKGSGKRK